MPRISLSCVHKLNIPLITKQVAFTMIVVVTVAMTLRQRSWRSTAAAETNLKILQHAVGTAANAGRGAVSESSGGRGSIDKYGKENGVASEGGGDGHHDFVVVLERLLGG